MEWLTAIWECVSGIEAYKACGKDNEVILNTTNTILSILLGIIALIGTLYAIFRRKTKQEAATKNEDSDIEDVAQKEKQLIVKESKQETSQLHSIYNQLQSLTPLNREELAKTYYGMDVEVTGEIFALTLSNCAKESDSKCISITMDVDKCNLITQMEVYFRDVNLDENPRLRESDRGDVITVKGKIDNLYTGHRSVVLSNVQIVGYGS